MPAIGDVDVGAQRTKVDDQAGDHYTGDELGEPNIVPLSYVDLCSRRICVPCADSLEIFRCTLHLWEMCACK